jgi:hypothetical protein
MCQCHCLLADKRGVELADSPRSTQPPEGCSHRLHRGPGSHLVVLYMYLKLASPEDKALTCLLINRVQSGLSCSMLQPHYTGSIQG